ncbi:GNAT family N-acetyltransferase [Pantoea agglomerans]|uniref:GNAT family N-acetyltransferase n=1 Tax=Enterobacter agglomerans TaxID=549 RepID=UPI000907002F|nr:GNAT family N-acetyltransferase [Pantoea agglomerans]
MDSASLEIGWGLVPEHNGKGNTIEPAQAIIDFTAEQTGATYLVAVADPENIPSHQVMQRLDGGVDAGKRRHSR